MRRAILLAAAFCAYGQHFEVASVKAADAAQAQVSRIDTDPAQFVQLNMPLVTLVSQAYRLKSYEYDGPAWLDTARYDINAKIPDGAPADQVPEMLRNLLAERFALKVHREKREMTVYDLVVATGGPKFMGSRSAEPGGADGYPTLPPEGGMDWTPDGKTALRMQLTMEQLASKLGSWVGRPVHDKTGLNGAYEIGLHWVDELEPAISSAPNGARGPSIVKAVETQLGLKLKPTKGAVEVLVVDHAERVPTEN
jgi:uncharacterized protein (TIGR03435 family)